VSASQAAQVGLTVRRRVAAYLVVQLCGSCYNWLMLKQALAELTNRDWALLIWSTIALVAALTFKPSRQALPGLLKLVFWSRIAVALLLMCAYNVILIFLGYKLGLWHWWMLKDTVFWFFGTAVVMFFSYNKAVKENHYFRHIVADNLKFAAALDFILNFYVFSLPVELILIPLVTLIAILVVVAGTKKEFEQGKKLFQGVQAIIGISVAAYAIWQLLSHLSSFVSLKNLEDYSLPIALTVLFLPFIYLLALYSEYELLLKRIGWRMEDNPEALSYARRQIIRACKLKLAGVKVFAKGYAFKLGGSVTKADVDEIISDFRSRPKENAGH
jgi:hypothetical protein